jgi:hypothetical protein
MGVSEIIVGLANTRAQICGILNVNNGGKLPDGRTC